MLHEDLSGGACNPATLTHAVARLNCRIRECGLSAHEAMFQRDMFTNVQLPISDHDYISRQHQSRVRENLWSMDTSSTCGKSNDISVGDLVYLHSEKTKLHARDRCLVTVVDGVWCNVRKFTGFQLRTNSYRVKQSECLKVHCDAALLTPVHCPDMSEPPPARDINAPPRASSIEIHAEPLVAFPVSAPAQVPTELAQSPDVYEEQPTGHSAPPTPVTATSAPP